MSLNPDRNKPEVRVTDSYFGLVFCLVYPETYSIT